MGKHTPTTQRAMDAIQFFEEQGREVVGVAIKGTEFRLEFSKSAAEQAPDVDLIDMSQ